MSCTFSQTNEKMFIKRSYLIIIGVLIIVLLSLLLGKFLWQDKPESIKKDAVELDSFKTMTVKNQTKEIKQIFKGEVIPSFQKNIFFNISGQLEKGDLILKKGSNFKANQLLYKLNLKDAFYTISSKKIALAMKITEALGELPAELSNEKDKWEKFVGNVTPAKRLPELPKFNSKKEILFFSEKRILGDYKELSNMEKDVENYFYLAPFDGFVLDVYSSPGLKIKAGKPIASIAKNDSFQVTVSVWESQSDQFEPNSKVDVLDANGNKLAEGTLVRKSKNKSKTMDLFFSIKPLKGQILNVGAELSVSHSKMIQNCVVLPKKVLKENLVTLLVEGKSIQRQITIVGEEGDSVLVTGLKDGEEVIK